MKKKILSLFLLLFFYIHITAQHTFTVSGTCMNIENKRPVNNSVFVLIHAKTREYKVYCDLQGKYRFILPDSLNGQTIFVHAVQDINLVHQQTTSEPCSIECTQVPIYSFSGGRFLTINTDSNRNYSIHFGGKVINNHLYFPVIYFKKNTPEISRSNYYLNSDSSVCVVKNILQCNKKWVIEIKGHCSSNEENKEQLSLDRANRVKEKLIALGIDPIRLITKGYGDKGIPECTEYIEEQNLHRTIRIQTAEGDRQAVSFGVIKHDSAQNSWSGGR